MTFSAMIWLSPFRSETLRKCITTQHIYFLYFHSKATAIIHSTQKLVSNILTCPAQWPSGLRRGPAADRLLRLRVRIPPGVRLPISCECRVCCRVEIPATGRSLVQRSPTMCGAPNWMCLEPSTSAGLCPRGPLSYKQEYYLAIAGEISVKMKPVKTSVYATPRL